MARLSDLSAELLLSIVSFVTQTDLLNISLTNRHLRTATEPELFREYVNRCLYGRSFLPFILLLLERPELVKYVQRLELKLWETLDAFNPMYYEIPYSAEFQFDTKHYPRPSELEYTLVTNAAKALGIIDNITPYELQSSMVNKVEFMLKAGYESVPQPWFKNIFDNEVETSQVSYSQRFCLLLSAGIEDPYVVLLIHLLPNVHDILIHGAPGDPNTLPWKLPRHKFDNLRQFSAQAPDGYSIWPAAFFKTCFEARNLETLELCLVSEYWRDPIDHALVPNPVSLKPGTLSLTQLHLKFCSFTRGEMKTLLEASPQMTSLYYSTRDCDGVPGLAPAVLIDLLKPFENSLEKLYMDMYSFPEWPFTEGQHIESMRHFSKLKYLDTRPEMWSRMDRLNVYGHAFQEDELLHTRLPPNIETLIFHDAQEGDGYEPSELASRQIVRFLLHQRELLPKLSSLTMVVRHRKVRRRLEKIISLVEGSHEMVEEKKPFTWDIHLCKTYPIFTPTIFDDIPNSTQLPLKCWTGTAYANIISRPTAQDMIDDNAIDSGGMISDIDMENIAESVMLIDELFCDRSAQDRSSSEHDHYDSEFGSDNDSEYETDDYDFETMLENYDPGELEYEGSD